MDNTTKKYLQVAGIVAGAGTILTLAGVRLYKMYKARKGNGPEELDETHRVFAPSYLGKHKPHHRKAKTNGQVHNVSVN